ncbi:MAG: VanZ family protein [Proteobacteria bacterium]|nr:VanZ family protein [Pseudomonadota bacterium]
MTKELRSRALFYLAAAFATLMALLPRPPALPLDWLGDKIHHMTAFVVLTWLACWGFHGARDRLIFERLAFFGAMIELVQSIPMLHRDCDIRDWLADALGIVLVLVLRRLYWQAARLVPRGA